MSFLSTHLNIVQLIGLLALASQSKGQALQGCAAVDCPNRYQDVLSPTCQVESTDMRLIGLLSTDSSVLQSNLTWTIGDSGLQSTIDGNERTVTRTFYLGVPEDVDLTSSDASVAGCAIFIISPDTGAYQVYGQSAPQYVNAASCVASMGETCIDDLTIRLEQLARSTSDANADSFCKAIADGLREESPSSCFITRRQPRIEAVALTGSTAPKPITAGQNSTSNCWPTLPKTNDLTKVFEYEHVAWLNETVPWLGYTPLITVFASEQDGQERRVEVEVECMKIVDSDDFSAGTVRNGTDSGSMEGSAISVRVGQGILGLAASIWLMLIV